MPDFSLRPRPGIHPSFRIPSSIHGTADPRSCRGAVHPAAIPVAVLGKHLPSPNRGKGKVCVYKALPWGQVAEPRGFCLVRSHPFVRHTGWVQSGGRAVPSALLHPSLPPPPAPGALHHFSQKLTYLGASMETASVMNDKSSAELNDGK